MTERRGDIEGVRGIAILLVIFYHAGVPFASGGFVGVDVFFALSGYLITGLLLHELRDNGRIAMLLFFARRARRLLPAAALTILATSAAAWLLLGPLDQQSFTGTGIAASLYVSNLWFAANATDYLAAPPDNNPFLHLWSLAVEEQFYLVWPVLMALVWRGAPRRLLAVLSIVCAGSFALTLYLQTTGSAHWAFFGSPARAWEFGAGALGALLPGRLPGWTAWLGLAGVLVPAVSYGALTPFPGVTALPPVLGTVVVLAGRPGAVRRALEWPSLQWIGGVSYSWYLWHWPVLVLVRTLRPNAGVAVGLACCLVALGIAWMGHHLVESPIRRLAWPQRRPMVALVAAGALTLGVLSGVLTWRGLVRSALDDPGMERFVRARTEVPSLYELGCHLPPEESTIHPCAFGDTESPVVVILWGDSHAAQWFPALERIAQQSGWRLETLTKSGCPPADLRGQPACDIWRTAAIERIRTLRPALVVLANASVYLDPLDTRQLATTQDVFRAAMARTLDAIAGIPAAVVSPAPRPGFDVPMCLARAAWHSPRSLVDAAQALDHACEYTPIPLKSPALEIEAVRARPSVTWLDISSAVCPRRPCAAVSRGEIVFRDDHHLTTRFAETLAPVLAMKLRPLLDGSDRQGGRL